MKISLSSSSSSSSSATNSFDRNLCDSHNATAGCLSTVFRRIFCAGSLRTHPFNGSELETRKDFKSTEEKIEAGVSPGIVARLMGLDSMPDLSLVRTPDSIGRSRSANSADYWSEFDPTRTLHRRVKSSLSFREMSTFLQKDNDEFLVLSFEKVGEKKKEDQENKKRNARKKNESSESKRFNEIKDSSSVPAYKKNNFSKAKIPLKKATNNKELSDGAKFEKKKKKNSLESTEKIVELECDSENSSPVSVLDLDNFLSENETIISDENLRPASSNSRRDLSLDLAKSDESICFEIKESKEIDKKGVVEGKKKKKSLQDQNQLHLWGEICKLIEEETMNSSWVPREMWRIEEYEVIAVEFALQILDRLVNDVATELAGFSMNNFFLQ